jgi:hypothetical protein
MVFNGILMVFNGILMVVNGMLMGYIVTWDFI